MAAKKKRSVRQMASIDDLPNDVRGAVLLASGQPVKIVLPEFDKVNWWRKSARARKIL